MSQAQLLQVTEAMARVFMEHRNEDEARRRFEEEEKKSSAMARMSVQRVKPSERQRMIDAVQPLAMVDRESISKCIQEILQKDMLVEDPALALEVFMAHIYVARPDWKAVGSRPPAPIHCASIAQKLLFYRACLCPELTQEQHQSADLEEISTVSLRNTDRIKPVLRRLRMLLARTELFYPGEMNLKTARASAAERLFRQIAAHPKYRANSLVFHYRSLSKTTITLDVVAQISENADGDVLEEATKIAPVTEEVYAQGESQAAVIQELQRQQMQQEHRFNAIQKELAEAKHSTAIIGQRLHTHNTNDTLAAEMGQVNQQMNAMQESSSALAQAAAMGHSALVGAALQGNQPTTAYPPRAPYNPSQANQYNRTPYHGNRAQMKGAGGGRANFFQGRGRGTSFQGRGALPTNKPTIPREDVKLEELPADLKQFIQARMAAKKLTMDSPCCLCGDIRRAHMTKECGFLWSMTTSGRAKILKQRAERDATRGEPMQQMNAMLCDDDATSMYALAETDLDFYDSDRMIAAVLDACHGEQHVADGSLDARRQLLAKMEETENSAQWYECGGWETAICMVDEIAPHIFQTSQ